MVVRISNENYKKIISQARAEFPLECCGLLGGSKSEEGWIIEKIYPLTNMDQSSEHFSMSPKEQFEVIKKLRESRLKLLGNYHSHPYTPSRPSEEDKKLAFDPENIYGIISLKEEEPVLKFFLINLEKQVTQLELKLFK